MLCFMKRMTHTRVNLLLAVGVMLAIECAAYFTNTKLHTTSVLVLTMQTLAYMKAMTLLAPRDEDECLQLISTRKKIRALYWMYVKNRVTKNV
jgi:hypothetical protein